MGSMKTFDSRNSSYLSSMITFQIAAYEFQYIDVYSITITNKGNNMEYKKIQEVFTVIDFSTRFHGEIPECIGKLQGLQV